VKLKILYARHDYHFFLSFSNYLGKIRGLQRSDIDLVSERYGLVMEKLNSQSIFNISHKHIKNYLMRHNYILYTAFGFGRFFL
jgi:hypothetical protein